MEEIIKLDDLKIKDMIFEIRGKQVMLSSDIAILYRVETKVLNQTIKRNIDRFPESFCFQLTSDEFEVISSRSQFVTLNKSGNLRGYNIKYLPYVLTEQGIMMLSGLLKSDIAVKVNIQIINAFVEMRKYLFSNNIENRISNIETKVIEYDNYFKILFDSFDSKINNYIFFEGEKYDAYSLLIDIFNTNPNVQYYMNEQIKIFESSTTKVIEPWFNFITRISNKYEN